MVNRYECRMELMTPGGKIKQFKGDLSHNQVCDAMDSRRFYGCYVLSIETDILRIEVGKSDDVGRPAPVLGVLICVLASALTISIISWVLS